MKKQRRKPKAKWEEVHHALNRFIVACNEEKPLLMHNALKEAREWAERWPNTKSRVETALAATVIRVIDRRLKPMANTKHAPESAPLAAAVLADLVAREARLRVVARARHKYLMKVPTSKQGTRYGHALLHRYINEALVDALRRLRLALAS